MTTISPSQTTRHRRGRLRRFSSALILAALFVASGSCSRYEPPPFRLNLEGLDRTEADSSGTLRYSDEKLQQIVDATTALFGTPDEPFVFEETELDIALLRRAAGPVSSDEHGNPRGLYREHCAHCHGVTGDGAGPTALFLNPYPRDFRPGVFKFTSTHQGGKPTDEDLRRTMVRGIPGTAMPSFALLPEEDLDALIEYVKYLSMRGESEQLIFPLVIDDEEELDEDILLEEVLEPVVGLWQSSTLPQFVVVPEEPRPSDRAASIAAGRELFQGERGCAKCHGPTGLGDGTERNYDMWNNKKLNLDREDVAARWSLPLQELRPRNLRHGVYRGGRRPLDIYRRIYAGVKGTPMPAAGPPYGQPARSDAMPEGSKNLSSAQIWNLVDYVLSLPNEEHPEIASAERPAESPKAGSPGGAGG